MSKLSVHLKLGRSLLFGGPPVYAHFGVTHRCNLQCGMCNIWRSGCRDSELSVRQINDLARQLADVGIVNVSIGGGEPFMRQDLPDIVRSFRQTGCTPRVLTNGVTASTGMIESVAAAGLCDVSVSLDSLDPGVQDHICNKAGAWSAIIESFGSFAAELPHGGMHLINTVVSHYNLRELPSLARFAKRIGWWISFVPVNLAKEGGEDASVATDDMSFALTDDDKEHVAEVYGELLAEKSGSTIVNTTSFLRASVEFLTIGRTKWPCAAGRLFLSVSPDGRVSPCHRVTEGTSVSYTELTSRAEAGWLAQTGDAVKASCAGCLRPCWAEISFAGSQLRSLSEMASAVRRAKSMRSCTDAGQIAQVAAEESAATKEDCRLRIVDFGL